MEVFPSNTCATGHRGEDKGNREGETCRTGACLRAGASWGEGEVGGALPAATIKWRRRHCMVVSFDTEYTLKNFGNAVSCGGPIAVGFRAMDHSNQGLQLFYLPIFQKSNFVYLEFSKYFSGINAMLHGSLGSWLPLSSSKLG